MGARLWRCLLREGDTPDEKKIKLLGFPFALVLCPMAVFYVFAVLEGTKQNVLVIGTSISAVCTALFMAGLALNFCRPGFLLDVVLSGCVLAVLFLDLGHASSSWAFRGWTFIVLVLDCALVFKRDHLSRYIITAVLLHITALEVESVERFGLYEFGYWGSRGVAISSCNC
eukprot:Hpha_TRINITY_DN15561_c3_g4::TRINITY_DN15561_c3_g4_i1::g.108893::m.108893